MTSGSGECTVLAGPRPLWPRPVAVTLAAAGSAVIAAGFDGDGASKQLFLLRVPRSGAPVEIARTPGSLRAKTAPPALLALESGKAWLAFVDRKGTLKAADLDPGRPVRSVPFREIASGVDSRFAPALVEETSGRRIAWTATGETMTIRVARMRPDGTVLRVEDPTPPAMGGTAPLFVAGAPRPVLLFVDARAGISPLLRLEDGDVAEIARPLGSLTEPPVLAAVHSSGGVLHVAYTAIGGAATTAIALARLDAEHTSPTALVPGTAYGPLSLAALAVGSRALFALEAPVDGGPGEAREIRLVGVDAAGSTPLAVLPGREGHAHAPSMARLEDGALAIAYRTSETVELTVLHCP